jgi:hypothetical protein
VHTSFLGRKDGEGYTKKEKQKNVSKIQDISGNGK